MEPGSATQIEQTPNAPVDGTTLAPGGTGTLANPEVYEKIGRAHV